MRIKVQVDNLDVICDIDAHIADESFDHEFGTKEVYRVRFTAVDDLRVNGKDMVFDELRPVNQERIYEEIFNYLDGMDADEFRRDEEDWYGGW